MGPSHARFLKKILSFFWSQSDFNIGTSKYMYLYVIVADKSAQVLNKILLKLRYGFPEQASRKSRRRHGEFLFSFFLYRLQG